eukprot:TRINITY_DN41088_c0_g1_i1.p2 TRINITY_DN41088_c0_g1~~TRINITY_DN41088_c0_g1_i1.p2  ORF type:complete len:204 (+),score=71.51 TRINITY_DN41088_c0_g1_i1:41-613(+)
MAQAGGAAQASAGSVAQVGQPHTDLLKATSEQFEKVLHMEFEILKKDIEAQKSQIEELRDAIGQQEEECAFWEQRVDEIKKSNATKLMLARQRAEASNRTQRLSRGGPAGARAAENKLNLIAEEGDECEASTIGGASDGEADAAGDLAAADDYFDEAADAANSLAMQVIAEIESVEQLWKAVLDSRDGKS